MSFNTPHGCARHRLPWSWSTFVTGSYARPVGAVRTRASRWSRWRPATATRSTADRGPLRAPLIVDALGWRRVLGPGANVAAARGAHLARSRGPPHGGGVGLDVWIDRSLVRRLRLVGAGGGERVGVGSYEPRGHVKDPTSTSRGLGVPPVRYQGNWFPHKLRPAGGRRLLHRRLGRPLLPALGRGDPHRVLLRRRLRSRAARVLAREAPPSRRWPLRRVLGRHARAFATALGLQRLIPRCRRGC